MTQVIIRQCDALSTQRDTLKTRKPGQLPVKTDQTLDMFSAILMLACHNVNTVSRPQSAYYEHSGSPNTSKGKKAGYHQAEMDRFRNPFKSSYYLQLLVLTQIYCLACFKYNLGFYITFLLTFLFLSSFTIKVPRVCHIKTFSFPWSLLLFLRFSHLNPGFETNLILAQIWGVGVK